MLLTPSKVVVVDERSTAQLRALFLKALVGVLEHRIERENRGHLLRGHAGGVRIYRPRVFHVELGQLLQRWKIGTEPGVHGHHRAAGVFERAALLANGHRRDDLSGVVAGNRSRLAGLLHIEVDFVLFRGFVLGLLWLFATFCFGCVAARLLLRFAQPLAQLLERRHLVRLLLHVEVVDFLFFQVDDAAGHLVDFDLAIPLDGVGGFDAFFHGFSTKHSGHSSQHAFELELRLIARLDICGQRHRRGGDHRHGQREI